VALACLLLAQGTVDTITIGKIRSEALEHSQIMRILHMLTDRHGPRVTGTPNHEAAVAWVIGQFNEWGLKNAHREAWDFGHAGRLNECATAFLVAPVEENLKFEVLAWTPSTWNREREASGPSGATHFPRLPIGGRWTESFAARAAR
jgi:hypothetical protein